MFPSFEPEILLWGLYPEEVIWDMQEEDLINCLFQINNKELEIIQVSYKQIIF